jgi:hypothetical protein
MKAAGKQLVLTGGRSKWLQIRCPLCMWQLRCQVVRGMLVVRGPFATPLSSPSSGDIRKLA